LKKKEKNTSETKSGKKGSSSGIENVKTKMEGRDEYPHPLEAHFDPALCPRRALLQGGQQICDVIPGMAVQARS